MTRDLPQYRYAHLFDFLLHMYRSVQVVEQECPRYAKQQSQPQSDRNVEGLLQAPTDGHNYGRVDEAQDRLCFAQWTY